MARASGSAPNGIGIAFLHGAQVVGDPCAVSASEPSPAPSPPSVDDVVVSLSARQDLQASGATDITLAGYSGKRIDLQLPAALACSQHYVFAEPQGLYAQGPSNRWRVWVLDANGETAIIVLMDYAGTPAADTRRRAGDHRRPADQPVVVRERGDLDLKVSALRLLAASASNPEAARSAALDDLDAAGFVLSRGRGCTFLFRAASVC